MKYEVRYGPEGPVAHSGDREDLLAEQVIAADVAFPMVYCPVWKGNVAGYFFPANGDEPVATMFRIE